MDELFDLAKAVYGGTLQLLCPEARVQWVNPPGRRAMNGIGLIVSGEDSRLSFRFAGREAMEDADIPEILLDAGLLPPRELSAIVELVDDCGDNWRTSAIQLHVQNALFPNRWMHPFERATRVLPITGREPFKLRAIVRSAKCIPLPQSRIYEEREGEKVVRHGMRGAFAKFCIAKASAVASRLDDEWIELAVEQDVPFTHEWIDAISTAFEFMTTYDCTPPAYQIDLLESLETTLLAGPFRRFRSCLPRPAGFTEPRMGGEFWDMFSRLVVFLLADAVRGRTVASELHAIRQASNTTLPTASLTLTASIESLATILIDKSSVAAAPEHECAEIERAIAAAKISDSVRDRVSGAVNQLRTIRAGDLLRAWTVAADCPLELVKKWSVLRNRSAHGVNIEPTQENWDLFSANAELLHRLIGWTIGYAGWIVESSRRGRPAIWIGSKN